MQELDKKIKRIVEDNPDLFKTEAAFWAWLRGGLRRGLWEKSPLKLRFKNKNVTPPPEGYTGRGRKGQYCALTNEWTPVSKMEVDHINGNKPLRCVDDILPFLSHLIAEEKELQLVAKEAHKIKSYAERQGISFQEASATKKAIAICKEGRDKEWLVSFGISPASNQKKRREQIISCLLSSSEPL